MSSAPEVWKTLVIAPTVSLDTGLVDVVVTVIRVPGGKGYVGVIPVSEETRQETAILGDIFGGKSDVNSGVIK